jgi:hypothetical protein
MICKENLVSSQIELPRENKFNYNSHPWPETCLVVEFCIGQAPIEDQPGHPFGPNFGQIDLSGLRPQFSIFSGPPPPNLLLLNLGLSITLLRRRRLPVLLLLLRRHHGPERPLLLHLGHLMLTVQLLLMLLLLLLVVVVMRLLLLVVVHGHLLALHGLGPLLIPPLGRLLGVVHVGRLLVSCLLLLLRARAVACQVADFLAYSAAAVVGHRALGQEAHVKQVLLRRTKTSDFFIVNIFLEKNSHKKTGSYHRQQFRGLLRNPLGFPRLPIETMLN